MKPLYIWAGGKNKMIPKYKENPGIPYTGYDTFVEPFFGGGAMMIHIYENNPTVKKFVLNDINPEIVGLYTAIKHDVQNFLTALDTYCAVYLPKTKAERKEYYYEIRKEYATDYNKWTPTQEAACLYFLMKTAFNGIWQSTKWANGRFCTPCGLLNQTTDVYDRANVLEWHTFLQKVDIHSGDWSACTQGLEGKVFYFMDPPYRDSFTQYGQTFGDQAHIDLINFCKAEDLKGNYVFYCNRDAADTFYDDNRGQLSEAKFGITYTAGRRATDEQGNKTAKEATEILLYSPILDTMKPVPQKPHFLDPNLFIEDY